MKPSLYTLMAVSDTTTTTAAQHHSHANQELLLTIFLSSISAIWRSCRLHQAKPDSSSSRPLTPTMYNAQAVPQLTSTPARKL
ncbi:hypothetical protein E2C01_018055 [Portunus trituberculatus]|uniref:Uncharacterized protein n=1 Tax=Portunus trituberculatus TaxID=210409 RepID=A0A5B7DTJ2_PORTR|nr:hypothetical protein [Portunus trituberculatus]